MTERIYILTGYFLSLILTILIIPASGQDMNIVFDEKDQVFILSNQLFERKIRIEPDKDQFYTAEFTDKRSGFNFSSTNSEEFHVRINGKNITGNSCRCIQFDGYKAEYLDDRSHLIVDLSVKGIPGLNIRVFYEIYPDLAGARKWIEFYYQGQSELKVEDLSVEKLVMDPGYSTGVDIYKNYGREWAKPPYTGGRYDPALLVRGQSGSFILGNEAPGIMKFISVYNELNVISIGLTPSVHDYPFRRYLSAEEKFISPKSFIILTREESRETAFEKDLGKYLRKYMGVKLFRRDIPPVFLYNTWNPFRINIHDKLIRELADNLENTGVEYLIIDDGWQDHNGDWNVNTEKFPDGLKPVTDYIREKGMKPGLWISLTIAEKESEAFNKYRHLAVKDLEGNPANLHGWSNNLDILTMNIASPWYDYIKEKMRQLVLQYGIEYFKIDLGMVKSAYIMEPERSGSFEETGEFKGREEFLYMAFERTMQLYDELADEFPALVIDCTFEIWGDWHIIDYALVKHADVDWISNFEAVPPEGSRTVRHLAWHRGLSVPASAMVIGNQKLEAPNHEFSFLSNFGSTPIMLGDPRKLTLDEKKWYKHMAGWLKEMHREYGIFKYYQTSGVFNPPGPHTWDGFARFNYEKDGGIVCVFRNDQANENHSVLLPWCKEKNKYEILEAESGESLGVFEGRYLNSEGFSALIPERNQGRAYEIRPVDK